MVCRRMVSVTLVLLAFALLAASLGTLPSTAQPPSAVYIVHPCLVNVQFRPEGVYGVFELPTGSQVRSVYGLVAGRYLSGSACWSGQSTNGITARSGYYLVRGCIDTSQAWWLILRGYGSEVRDPRNWYLHYNR